MKRLSALLLAFACIASLQADPLASRNRASIDDSGTYRGNFALNRPPATPSNRATFVSSR